MRIAYFTNQYPKVSHSFIRREILALEALGYSVSRFALRSDEAELVDPLDQSEFNQTSYVLYQSKSNVLKACFAALIKTPSRFLCTLMLAIRLGIRSDRGVLRNIAYFIESCVLLRWEQDNKIRHIHAHFGTNSTAVVMFAKLMGGADYSFTVHGPEEFDKPEFISLATKIKHSSFVVAISSYGRSQLFRWIPSEQWHKVKIVHCGLDAKFLSDEIGEPYNSSNNLICVGRLCEQKGQLLLLDAMRTLIESDIDCHLILAGDGPMRSVIERRINEYNLQGKVSITGWISSERVKELLLNCRGLVLPSFAEGLPVVLMESLALRRPVISTYVAGIPELVHNNENGWLIPAGDVEALSYAMRELLSASNEHLRVMGENGHAAVFERHNIDTEAKKLASLFAKAED